MLFTVGQVSLAVKPFNLAGGMYMKPILLVLQYTLVIL